MHTLRIIFLSVLLALLAVSPTAAQIQHDPSDHVHEKLGTVIFPVSCRPDVQANFNRGVALLHSFWYDEAERTFREVAAADPKCGMAWWGVAMANYHPIWAAPIPAELARGMEAAKKAKSLGARTARERAYINAIAAFYKDAEKTDHQLRARAYEAAMEKLTSSYPDDDEASIFYALSLIAHGMSMPNDKTYAFQKRAAEILNARLAEHPEHPGISHYVIHSFDYPALAPLAVEAAHAYSKIAPDSAHALHMPSHIFVRLGMWPETIESNLASASAGKKYAARNKPGATAWDSLHAYDYLAYAYLQRGEDDKVQALIDELPSIKALDTENFAGYYAIAAIPVRYLLERRDWARAAALQRMGDLPAWKNYPFAEALISFARAVGAARSGDPTRARAEVQRLQQLRQTLLEKKNNYWAEQVDIQRREAEAWIARTEGRNDEALALLRSAAEIEDATEKHPVTPGWIIPAREWVGELLLELNHPDKALAEFERSLKDNPKRLNGLTGAARSAQLSGNREKARQYYVEVAELLRASDATMRASVN